jgi:hypothetical protein
MITSDPGKADSGERGAGCLRFLLGLRVGERQGRGVESGGNDPSQAHGFFSLGPAFNRTAS